MKNIYIFYILIFCSNILYGQDTLRKDKAIFREYKNGYYQDSILKGITEFKDSLSEIKRKYLATDLTGIVCPQSPNEFTKYWFNLPVSQGNTGTCWSFATTSFFESEIYRITEKKVKLSEMYFVYLEYVERAKYFILHKGDCTLGEGSEANAVPRLMLDYGAIPKSAYNGLMNGQTVYDHSKMYDELYTYLMSVKAASAWNDSIAVKNVKAILNKYMGQPPDTFYYENKEYSAQSFLTDYCKIIPRDYFSFMSDNRFTFNQKAELVEDDNWWHSGNYYNVGIDNFMKIVKSAITNGYTISICGDVSEAGIDKEKQVAVVPSFDIPSEFIDDNARQLRLGNGTTTDDHCIHLVGYLVKDGIYWFLTKDSGAGAFDGKYQGYKYLSEDFVKLKMMNILLYKYAAKEVLDKIIK